MKGSYVCNPSVALAASLLHNLFLTAILRLILGEALSFGDDYWKAVKTPAYGLHRIKNLEDDDTFRLMEDVDRKHVVLHCTLR